MPTLRLIAIEAALVFAAGLIIYWILADPFASVDGDRTEAMAPSAQSSQAVARLSPTPTPQPATATPAPTPDPLRCGPLVDVRYMRDTQIVSYYGNPYTPQMGILGELQPDELVSQVQAKAAEYDALNGARGARAAIHIVHGTAQEDPGRDGLHLLYVDDDTLREYIDLACEHGLLVFIDLQIGRSTVKAEMEKALQLLDYPHVHLAIDPEFAMPPGEVPGQTIGTVDASDINTAQALIQAYVEERGLSDKILIVHRFTENMITRFELVEDYPRIRLVVDMDGFGPIEVKQVKYGWFAAIAEYSGIKLFYQHDTPLMTVEEVLPLRPDVIIYQ